MKTLAMTVLAMAVAAGAQADQVTVYVAGASVVPVRVLGKAQLLANDMFADAGVRIDWRRGEPSPSLLGRQRAILIEMLNNTPDERRPGVFAFALPYEGVHIDVFYDRVQAATRSLSTPNVLAHVLVHEITHILQGLSRHSEKGVMKAYWNRMDYEQMDRAPLSFTEEDIRLIQFGLAKRASGIVIASYPR